MKIKKNQIKNWRSIVNETIEFNELMIFIGQNNHGKSNVLNALLFFFGEIGCQDLDYHEGSTELFVEVTFGDLNESEQTTFKKYVSADNSIKVRKSNSKDTGTIYQGWIQSPEDLWLQENNILEYKKRDVASELPLIDFLPETGRITGDDFKKA